MVLRLCRYVVGVVAAMVLCQAAQALNPKIRLEDLNHASWSEKDGLPGDIQSMAQTRDGWLWLGTADGLYRFDGIRFERVPLKHKRLYNLHALDNGDLLVSYMLEGLSLLHPDGSVTELLDPDSTKIGSIASMAMYRDGAIWVLARSGLHRYAHGTWTVMSAGLDWAGDTFSLLIDQYGRVWASNDHSLYLYDRSVGKLERLPGTDLHGSLIQSPDGRIWLAGYDAVQPVPAPPMGQPLPRAPDFNQAESRWAGQFDRDGNLWALKCPYGVCRVLGAGKFASTTIVPSRQAEEKLDQHWQLSALSTNVLLEDREGNIWVSTQSGLDRFRENKLIPARIPGPTGVYSIATDTEGKLWVAEANSDALWQVAAEAAPQRDPRVVRVVANDHDGALLLAGKRDIERVYHGRSSRIAMPMPDGSEPVDLTVVALWDDGKVLWLQTVQFGLRAYVDGKWLPRARFKLPKRIYMAATVGRGQMWLSHNDGGISFYDNDQLSEYDIGMVGSESGIFPGPQVVVGGDLGLAVLRGKSFELLAPRDAEALRNVTGLAVTPDGDRWLNGGKGVVHIRRDDWEASMRQPSLPLVYEAINVLEGYPGRATMDSKHQTIYNAGNGQLWLRATGGLVRLDTAELRPNTVKPTVRLISVNTDRLSYPAGAVLRLPPDTRTFNIQYTAPGLRKPEAMRFQYKLDGVDERWQDAGSRRAAYYTNIGPGHYSFKVRSTNEDGMLGDAIATMALEVAPTVTQTWWFRLLCALAGLLALYGLYRYRLSVATAAISRQLQVRMDERVRIARTLHDTFLQSVQALTLRVYAVLAKLPEGSEPRVRLEAILDDADRTIVEGRDQVQQLRNGYDIEQILEQTGVALATMYDGTGFDFSVSGQRRPLTPPVQEELCEIGSEALRNAFQHAQASMVTLQLEYRSGAFVLRIADNGRGLDDAEVQRRHQQGHWGLVGMRERARRVGSLVDIASAAGKGTTVEVKVAAALAFDGRAQREMDVVVRG